MRYVFDQYDIAGVICMGKGKDLEIVFLSVVCTIITWSSIEKNVFSNICSIHQEMLNMLAL